MDQAISFQTASEQTEICKYCKTTISMGVYYCPNCGKKLRDKPPSTGVGAQVGLYLLSILLPPFGIIPAIRYLRQKETKSKVVGMVALILTVFSIVATLYYAIIFVNEYNRILNSQLNLNQFGY